MRSSFGLCVAIPGAYELEAATSWRDRCGRGRDVTAPAADDGHARGCVIAWSSGSERVAGHGTVLDPRCRRHLCQLGRAVIASPGSFGLAGVLHRAARAYRATHIRALTPRASTAPAAGGRVRDRSETGRACSTERERLVCRQPVPEAKI